MRRHAPGPSAAAYAPQAPPVGGYAAHALPAAAYALQAPPVVAYLPQAPPAAGYAAHALPAAAYLPHALPAAGYARRPRRLGHGGGDRRPDDAEAGKRLDYRITVHNLGPTAVRRARVEQEMPATTTSATAPGATVEGRGVGRQKVIWRSDLPAHDIQVFTATAVLGDRADRTGSAAPGTLRAAATVCVYVDESFAPRPAPATWTTCRRRIRTPGRRRLGMVGGGRRDRRAARAGSGAGGTAAARRGGTLSPGPR
ncbi:hypothetical protein O1L68_21095 [Streptomyces lydicus]|nr:hypothetical protein [Streptomyces lydicus]